jgi:coproporphyrinogen III oxidase-like Fe-S oxidoreductase
LALVSNAGHGRVEDEALTPAECADEALLMGLRLTEGLDLDRLASLAGTRPSDARIGELAGIGMLERLGETRIRATAQGRMVLNRVVLELAKGMA